MTAKMKPLIGLVMIVKDEEVTMPWALKSVLPLIGSWTICDTGSTDRTKEFAKAILGHLPGRLYEHKWRNFGHNLNLALDRAKGTAQWLLRLDADMEVTFVNDNLLKWLGRNPLKRVDAWDVEVLDHGTTYRLPLLMRGGLDWRYVGPTHEYLDATGRTTRQLHGFQISHNPPQADRTDKLERDIELLRPGFRAHDPRAIFYTAECHRFLGNFEQAALIYDLRAEMEDGWEEERWYADYQSARLRGDLDRLIQLYYERPWRHEPLTAAGKIVGQRGAAGDSLFLEAVE